MGVLFLVLLVFLKFAGSFRVGTSLEDLLGNSLFVLFLLSSSFLTLLERWEASLCSAAFLLKDSSDLALSSLPGEQTGELLLVFLDAPPAFFYPLSGE